MESKYQEALDRLCENNYFDEKGNCNCDLIVMDRMLLQELVENIKPYKFEDLKPNMWVWDDEFKDCIKIKIVFEPCKLYPKGSLKAYHDLNEEQLNFIEFEENRLFPVQMANEVQL